MSRSKVRSQVAALLLPLAAAACAAAPDNAQHEHPADSSMSMPMGMAEPVIPAGAMYVAADVKFMQGMIPHHAQAVVMSRMAASHGANAQLLLFTQKIDISQRGEIELMQNWLFDREQEVPDSNAHLHMTMAGMLTEAQLKELDAAKGKAFDKLFLVFMIQHHEGALKMVQELRAATNSMTDYTISSFASDVFTDQSAEIAKMHQMLDAMN